MKNNFYVYAHTKATDGSYFYIGKGHGKRAYDKRSRNQYWHNTVAKYGYNVTILADNLSEDKAFELEQFIIEEIGRDNLCNMTDGGEGASGAIRSEETRAKMSAANKGKNLGRIRSKEHKQKLSASLKGNQYRLGKTHTEETKAKISVIHKGKKYSDESRAKISAVKFKPIIQYDIQENFIREWDSITQATLDLNLNRSSISHCLTGRQKTAGGFIWKFK